MIHVVSGSIKNLSNSIAHQAPHLLSEWDAEKNQVSATQVTYGSTKKYWWKCVNGHVWDASPNNRFHGSNCPFCSNRKLCFDNSLAVKCPHLIKEWALLQKYLKISSPSI